MLLRILFHLISSGILQDNYQPKNHLTGMNCTYPFPRDFVTESKIFTSNRGSIYSNFQTLVAHVTVA